MMDSSSSVSRGPRRWLSLCVVACVAAVVVLHVLAARPELVELRELQHVAGLRYRAALPEGLPAGDHHDADGNWIKCSPAFLLEDGARIGSAHTLHQDIAEHGGGGFSHWGSALNFSSSDQSDPRVNGRSYALAFPHPWAGSWLPGAYLALAAALLLAVFTSGAGRRALRGVFSRATAWRLATLAGGTVMALLLAEVVLRVVPAEPVLASTALGPRSDAVPVMGDVLRPGTRFVYDGQPGNVAEFHTDERVNRWGFLDVDHPLEKPPGALRVLVLGDSFVQADQVAMADKWPRRLEALLAERLARPVDVVALGRDGAGISNQVGYWRGLGRFLDPDLVLLMMTARNDFSDDSLRIQSLNRNFEPEHPPRFWFVRDGDGFREVPPDVHWRSHRTASEPTALQRAYAWLRPRSSLAGALGRRLERDAAWRERLIASGGVVAREASELRELEQPLAYWRWCYVDRARWPRWQEDGFAVTRHALRTLRDEVAELGDARLFVALDSDKLVLARTPPREIDGYELRYERPNTLARQLLAELEIPALSLDETFARRDAPTRAHWEVDGHWNETGNRWAAEDIADWLLGVDALRGASPARAAPPRAESAVPKAPSTARPDAAALDERASPAGLDAVRALFERAARASTGGSADNDAFAQDPRGFTEALLRADEPADLACAQTAQVFGQLLDSADVTYRVARWVGESERYLGHQSLEVWHPGHGWTLYDPHLGLAFEPGFSALETFEWARTDQPLAPRVALDLGKATWEPAPRETYARYDSALALRGPESLVTLVGDATHDPEAILESWNNVDVRATTRAAFIEHFYVGDVIDAAPQPLSR